MSYAALPPKILSNPIFITFVFNFALELIIIVKIFLVSEAFK